MSRPYLVGRWLPDRDCYHIETDLGIINIRPGLQDKEGNRVCNIEVKSDGPLGAEGYACIEGNREDLYRSLRVVELARTDERVDASDTSWIPTADLEV